MPRLPDPDFSKWGNAADHLTKEVRPYVISRFGTSSDPANWGVVGWSAGRTVMAKHGPYGGVSGYFDDSQEPADDKSKNLPDLCAAALAVNIGCALHVYTGYHTWQFGARAFSDALPWIAQTV